LSKDRTCQWLANSIDNARDAFDFDLWAYVFMPEHVHLIVHPSRVVYEIEDIRQAIKEPCARDAVAWLVANAPEWLPRISVNKKNRVRRHFWQKGGGYDRNIEEPRTLLEMIGYIHENPVRRRLVERAIDWKWSSANWYVTGEPGPLRIDPIPPEWITL
jgi:putative transposase